MAFEDILITEIQEVKIKDKAPDKMPLNPTAQGWSGQEVRRQLSRSLLDNTDSVFSEVKSKLTLIKDYFDANQEQVDEIVSDIADLQDSSSYKMSFYGKANANITKGQAVQFSGVENETILLAPANSFAISLNKNLIIGIANENINEGNFGKVLAFGVIEDVSTSNFSEGDFLWYNSSSIVDGSFRTTPPNAPYAKILMAAVVKASTEGNEDGVIFVRLTTEPRLSELQDVHITNIGDSHILRYDSSTSRYINVKSNKVIVSENEPSQNKDNDIWFDI
jgi:hypothetical protein